ncbi:MAG: hypothetical protein OH316_01660 [Candidatus Parvarchaeota archaeon]|nr:hypothetical protein [Candidatus Parvarchaeota archaeon]MCW1301820.1 hypothetical protein [Candidatus Parvarchaeota archaeon]
MEGQYQEYPPEKRHSALESLLIFFGVIVILFISLPFVVPAVQAALIPHYGQYVGNSTQGVIISNFRVPSSVPPDSVFSAILYVSNNLNGNNAQGIRLCLDNLGIILNQSQICQSIPSLFAGGTLPEIFSLKSPPNSFYGNMPYTQEIGYYITYPYSSTLSQPLEFLSQQAELSGKYPPVPTAFNGSSGPVRLSTSTQGPVVYSDSSAVGISLLNTGGEVLGNVTMYLAFNSSLLDIPNSGSIYKLSSSAYCADTAPMAAAGLKVLCINLTLGLSGLQLSYPVNLTDTEASSLISSNTPYVDIGGQFYVGIRYDYETNGFFPLKLQTEVYNFQ